MNCAVCGDEIERIETNGTYEWAHLEQHHDHLAQPVREVLL